MTNVSPAVCWECWEIWEWRKRGKTTTRVSLYIKRYLLPYPTAECSMQTGKLVYHVGHIDYEFV